MLPVHNVARLSTGEVYRYRIILVQETGHVQVIISDDWDKYVDALYTYEPERYTQICTSLGNYFSSDAAWRRYGKHNT